MRTWGTHPCRDSGGEFSTAVSPLYAPARRGGPPARGGLRSRTAARTRRCARCAPRQSPLPVAPRARAPHATGPQQGADPAGADRAAAAHGGRGGGGTQQPGAACLRPRPAAAPRSTGSGHPAASRAAQPLASGALHLRDHKPWACCAHCCATMQATAAMAPTDNDLVIDSHDISNVRAQRWDAARRKHSRVSAACRASSAAPAPCARAAVAQHAPRSPVLVLPHTPRPRLLGCRLLHTPSAGHARGPHRQPGGAQQQRAAARAARRHGRDRGERPRP